MWAFRRFVILLSERITGILLAAGSSARFGAPKLLATLANGAAVGMQSAEAMAPHVDDLLVVLRPGDSALERLFLAREFRITIAPDAAAGMGHSLAHAVRCSSASAAWLVGLADMPFVAATTMRALCHELRNGAKLVAPFYRDRRGNPVGFSCRYKDELEGLTGDQGAREILRRDRAEIVRVGVSDPGIFSDIDRPSDLPGGCSADQT